MTVFVTWPFPATGTTTNRTLPDRLSEVKNILDFGANPAGESTTAIQNAVDAAIAEGGGTVFVPPGNYTVNAPITFNDDSDFSLCIRGCGGASYISGSFSGYIFDRHLATPNNTYGPRTFENIKISNGTGGCIRLGSTIGGAVRNSALSSNLVCFTSEDEPGASSQAITLDQVDFGTTGGDPTGSGCAVLGGSGIITGCDVQGLDIAWRFYGGGILYQGTRVERCNTGFLLGVDSADTDRGLNGLVITGVPMEGVIIFMDFAGTVTGFSINGVQGAGHNSANAGAQAGILNSQTGVLIRADKAYAGEFNSCGFSSFLDTAAFYIEDYTTRANVTFTNCTGSIGSGDGVPWRISTSSSGFKFLECSPVDGSQNAPLGTRYAFSGLPGSGQRLEGDEYDLYDANTTTLGVNVTAGGSTGRVRVRFDGTNWVCIGP